MNEERFVPTDEDMHAIEIAINVARRLLQDSRISASEVIGIGLALLALERFPEFIEGMHVEFGVTYTFGDEEFRERNTIKFGIYESLFEFYRGGSVYEKGIGHDSFSLPGWSIDVTTSHSSIECELATIEDDVDDYLNVRATIHVSNESEVDLEEMSSFE